MPGSSARFDRDLCKIFLQFKIFIKIFMPRPLRESDKKDFLDGQEPPQRMAQELSNKHLPHMASSCILKIFVQGPLQGFHHKDLYKILAKIFIPPPLRESHKIVTAPQNNPQELSQKPF